VRIDQSRPGGAAQANDLGATAGRGAGARPDGQDPPVGTGRDLRLAAGKQDCFHSP